MSHGIIFIINSYWEGNMKFRGDKRYFYWGLTCFFTVCACLLVYYILFHGVKVQSAFDKLVSTLMPIILGFVFAYVLAPILNGIEKKIIYPILSYFHNKKLLKIRKNILDAQSVVEDEKVVLARENVSKKLQNRIRIISVFLTVIIMLLAIHGLFSMLIPQLVGSVENIVSQSGHYLKNISEWVHNLADKYPFVDDFISNSNFKFSQESIVSWLQENVDLEKYLQNIGGAFSTVYKSVFDIIMALFNLILGIIISVYLLFSKETFLGQAKKIVYAVLDTKDANYFIKDMRFVHKTFIGFLSGKIIDSIIIGILCFIGTSIIGTPYPVFISVIIGVTNVIPFFGPYLGAIPCSIFLLMIEPIHCLYFIIFILFLQQLDGNVIGPKILGESTGLSSFWVIFAITFFGGIFGVFGMLIGVPAFAVIFAFIRIKINRKLKRRGLPIETEKYMSVTEINNKEFVVKNDKLKSKQSKKESINYQKFGSKAHEYVEMDEPNE